MAFIDDLRTTLETEERETAGGAFGGSGRAVRKSYSVPRIRDWILAQAPFAGATEIERGIANLHGRLPKKHFKVFVASLIRFSFLIELTNLKVGSTKMKTRWLPGRILMPQPDSFEPIQGVFEPGNDPRSSTFDACLSIFTRSCRILTEQACNDDSLPDTLASLNSLRRVPYEFPLSYGDPSCNPVHESPNVTWALTDDLRWLLSARQLLRDAETPIAAALRQIEKKKLEVKVFKTDRALTGKDKTNRAKRWEVLVDDFQHATLEQCWSAERKLTADLVCFHDFPTFLRGRFVESGSVPQDAPPTRCPVTLEQLSFRQLSTAVLDPKHGVSACQIGHLHPLKRDGKHDHTNVCWQSANGNRIQGDLTIEETEQLLSDISARRTARNSI